MLFKLLSKKYFLFLLFILIILFPTSSFAAYPKLISTITNAFDTIKTWIVRIATPAAAVAIRFWLLNAKI